MSNSKLKSIDLFAGIGGIRLGFERAFGDDISTVFVSEWDKHAQKTYKANFEDDFDISGDITKIPEENVPKFDICLAGFPCQAFSFAGSRKGFADDYKGMSRGTLFFDVARICAYHKPKVIFCENVKGLEMHDKGKTFTVIKNTLKTLSDEGYKVFAKVLNSRDFGVPQNRERIYIVAFRNDIDSSEFEFPLANDSSKRIKDIIEKEPVSPKYYLSETYIETLRKHKARHEAKGNGFGYEIRDWDDVAGAIVCGGMGRERNLLIDKRQTDLIPVTHIKGEINKEGIRKMTPREWARLQGYDDSYVLPLADVHLYNQLGNSVSVPVIEAIAKQIKLILEKHDASESAVKQQKCEDSKGKGGSMITGNRGEWSEIFIFLKLMCDRKIHAADAGMNRLDDVFLNIIKIIREELRDHLYEYYTGDVIKIYLNNVDSGRDVHETEFIENRDRVFNLLSSNDRGTFGDVDVENFLRSIFVTKLKAPAISSGNHFGGTQDITMSVMDYRSGITRTVGFSCKSDFGGRATLFNASYDNTNFMYQIIGNINDNLMNSVNSMFVQRGGKNNIATRERIRALKSAGCELEFIKPCKDTAARNLVLSGGNELPEIIGCALKYYYWEGENTITYAPIRNALEYVVNTNPAKYRFDNLDSIYKRKFSDLLYDMFTGMRMAKAWDGRSSVNGGYVVMKNDGDVLAYHSCIADEFKDFLVSRLGFETPSNSRHNAMQVYKQDGKYYINFNLQVRFC